MRKRIYLSPPNMGGQEREYVKEAFDQNWIAPLGPNVDGFEEDICNFTGAKSCSVLSSGTAAIHLALILSGVGRGDEVLVSTFTFSATVNPIIYVGATPIFIESEAETWNICPDTLRSTVKDRIAKGRKPKALVLVHLYGMPAKMDEIISICQEFEIELIEDAAEALGSRYKNKFLGTFGRFGVYSFNGNKIITTSGGGALVSQNKADIVEAINLATQARDKALHYEHSKIGYNYRMSNIVAGVGRGQMVVLKKRVEEKRSINNQYRELFKNSEMISILKEPNGDYYSNYWLTTIVLEKGGQLLRNNVINALESQNIESRPLWKPMHLQPIFKQFPYYGNKFSEQLFQNGLCIPSGTDMPSNTLEEIAALIKKAL